MTSFPGLEKLKNKRDLTVAKANKASLGGGDELFADAEPKVDAGEVGANIDHVTIFDGIQIGLGEKRSSKKDLLILMEATALDKAFAMIMEDTEPAAKRVYRQGKATNDVEPDEEAR